MHSIIHWRYIISVIRTNYTNILIVWNSIPFCTMHSQPITLSKNKATLVCWFSPSTKDNCLLWLSGKR